MSRPAGRYMLFRAASGKRDSDVSWLVAGGIFLVALGVGYVVLSSEIGHPAAARRIFGRVLILLAVVFLALALFLTLPASAKGETWLALLGRSPAHRATPTRRLPRERSCAWCVRPQFCRLLSHPRVLQARGQGTRNPRLLRARNLGADRLLSVGRKERRNAHRLGQSATLPLVPRYELAHSPSPQGPGASHPRPAPLRSHHHARNKEISRYLRYRAPAPI